MIEDLTEERPCANPDCDEEQVEPETDGDVRFWECESCGYAWGYERLSEATKIEGSCSLGVPESVRRAASGPVEAQLRKPGVVDLGLTIGRRPE
jgi:hypothetical protein